MEIPDRRRQEEDKGRPTALVISALGALKSVRMSPLWSQFCWGKPPNMGTLFWGGQRGHKVLPTASASFKEKEL